MFNTYPKMPIVLICGLVLLIVNAQVEANPLVAKNSESLILQFLDGQVQTAELKPVTEDKILKLPTLSFPKQKAKLFSRITGFIKVRYADIGDKVKKNDVLAIIDEPQIKAQENKIMADIDQAKSQLELAQLNAQRAEFLVADNLISAAERDKLRILRLQAIAQIASLQAQLQENQARQAFMQIRAPFDGVIVDRNLEVGDLVTADTTQNSRYLYEIMNTQTMGLKIHVPQNDIKYIAVGDAVSVTFTGYQNLSVKGFVSRLSQSVNAQSGSMLVEAEFDNSSYNLPSGLRGAVLLNTTSNPSGNLVFKAPLSALSYHQGKDAVVALKNGETQFHKVEIVSKSKNSVLLSGNLSGIGKIVLNPNALLMKGG